jgi:hypothetical protein
MAFEETETSSERPARQAFLLRTGLADGFGRKATLSAETEFTPTGIGSPVAP